MQATYLVTGQYDLCVAECATAVEVGTANSADPKLIAKAHARAGRAYVALPSLATTPPPSQPAYVSAGRAYGALPSLATSLP